MTHKSLPISIRTSRVHTNRGEDYISLRIEEKISGIEFLDAEISFENFAKMLTGSAVEVDAEFLGLMNLGKKYESVRASVFISEEEYGRVTSGLPYDGVKKALGQWLRDNHSREGWATQTYLSSQSSIKHCDGGYILNYGYSRYVAV
jgi:hypothetical protein